MNRSLVFGLVSFAMLAGGCRVRTRTGYRPTYVQGGGQVVVQQQPQPQPQPAQYQGQGGSVQIVVQGGVQQQAVPQGVTVIEQHCTPGAQEQCNGVDDNCNGAIDEGCGYSSGNIQVTAAWNTASDIDLHVFDPQGEEVYYGARQVASGGQLDHDANAACSVQPPTVENVYWGNNPPRGTFRAVVRAYDMCGSPYTPVTLSISVGGRVIGTYQFALQQRNQEFAIPFNVQ